MAINMSRKETLGCAYYNVETETLFIMQEARVASVETIEQCMLQFKRNHTQSNTK